MTLRMREERYITSIISFVFTEKKIKQNQSKNCHETDIIKVYSLGTAPRTNTQQIYTILSVSMVHTSVPTLGMEDVPKSWYHIVMVG